MDTPLPLPACAGEAPLAEPPHSGAPLHVLVVDDQLAVRRGLIRLLQCAAGLPPLVLHEAASLAEASATAHACPPHLVLLDVDLAGEDGLTLLPLLVPTSTVVVVTSHAADATVRHRALVGGAAAVLNKAQPGRELAGAVRELLARTTA